MTDRHAPDVTIVRESGCPDSDGPHSDGPDSDTTAAFTVDNGVLRLRIDDRGLLTSLVDLESGREVLPPGAVGNLLQVHRDIPNQWDAWDIDRHYRRVVTDLESAESVRLALGAEGGPVIAVTRRFGASRIDQRISLPPGSHSVRISTDVDWHERQKLLKLAFPIDVAADRSASETQFGHVFRPTHTNTSWEAAKFEICAHRWIQVGEPGFGVAIANDSTYGHDVSTSARPGGGTFTTVRLSLLRAPLYPDPDADQGRHVFEVSVTPGAGIAGAVRAGYELNLPIRTVRGSRGVAPLVTVSNPAVVVEAVKLAEDRSGDVIVRLYESLGRRIGVTVTAGFDTAGFVTAGFDTAGFDTAGFVAAGVTQTDLLERPVPASSASSAPPAPPASSASSAPPASSKPPANGQAGQIRLELRPFELVTLRVRRAG